VYTPETSRMKRTSVHSKNMWIKQLCSHKVWDLATAFQVRKLFGTFEPGLPSVLRFQWGHGIRWSVMGGFPLKTHNGGQWCIVMLKWVQSVKWLALRIVFEVTNTALSNIWRKWGNVLSRFGKLEVFKRTVSTSVSAHTLCASREAWFKVAP